MIWSSMKFVPQKYHNFVIIHGENTSKLMTNSERKSAVKRLDLRGDGIYHWVPKI